MVGTTAIVEHDEFRHVLGHFASGVTVVTGHDQDGPAGFTCQSFFSLSLDPPLIAIAPAQSSSSWPRVKRSGAFCVNVLRAGQEQLGLAFARSGGDKFAGIDWTPAPTGAPLLDGVLAWIDCTIEAVHDTGDHHLVIGKVSGLAASAGEPLIFYRAGFGDFADRPLR